MFHPTRSIKCYKAFFQSFSLVTRWQWQLKTQRWREPLHTMLWDHYRADMSLCITGEKVHCVDAIISLDSILRWREKLKCALQGRSQTIRPTWLHPCSRSASNRWRREYSWLFHPKIVSQKWSWMRQTSCVVQQWLSTRGIRTPSGTWWNHMGYLGKLSFINYFNYWSIWPICLGSLFIFFYSSSLQSIHISLNQMSTMPII